MKIILTTNIKKLGKKIGKAFKKIIKDSMKEKESLKLEEAKQLIDKISKIKIIFNKEADEKQQLYGSISKKEILDFFRKNSIIIKSDDLIINDQIKSIGEHQIQINPYMGISKEFTVVVNKN